MCFTDMERAKTTPELLKAIEIECIYFKDKMNTTPIQISSGGKLPNGLDIMVPNPLYDSYYKMFQSHKLHLSRRLNDTLKLYY